MEYILAITVALLVACLGLLYALFSKNKEKTSEQLMTIETRWTQLATDIREELHRSRMEQSGMNRETRQELTKTLKDLTADQAAGQESIRRAQNILTEKMVEQLERMAASVTDHLLGMQRQLKADSFIQREAADKVFKDFGTVFDKSIRSLTELQQEKLVAIETAQRALTVEMEKKLEGMRKTVDEKLQRTLNERLGRSFELVGKQLERVQRGLGEMQTLAQDVGGLKKVLSNVKLRGGIGEVQLAMLLEQVLAPGQYAANVRTKAGSREQVEFAIKLPGRDPHRSEVWLPVDAKFPKDVYEKLIVAHEHTEPGAVVQAQKELEQTIRKMAADIRQKYIDPPNTTDFAIMFLPFEGIYAEVVRHSTLLQLLQKEYKVIVTGPTTFAAILNSLQMGFRTLAIQKRSGEVWQVLASVKQEFENFAGMLGKAQKNIQTGLGQLDEVMGRRTKAIQRKLKEISDPRDTTTFPDQSS